MKFGRFGHHGKAFYGIVEGELVAVIGKKARHLTRADAFSCVLG
jgi:2-keto-4-pentenoate hydratase/2-oxohepta-3-ene-1,7-dioic acid hydratase in catechol pathway